MKRKYDAKILYFEKKAKLAELIETRVGDNEDSDRFKTTRLLTLDGIKLRSLKDFVVHAHNEQSVKICNHRVLCYDEFFVIEKVSRKLNMIEQKETTKYHTQLLAYQGNEICSFDAPWNEADYFNGKED